MSFARNFFLLLIFCCFWITQVAWAFPEMVRHGYANCLTCHSSPGGGGVLSAYGREISRELLSTWGIGKESEFAWGVVPTPEWLDLSLQYRGLQLISLTERELIGRWIPMQADLEGTVTWGPAALTLAGGFRGGVVAS